ncbi:hypothetical protein Fmac_033038 [Flemingia macrophylla]|uniref:Uncharacterized protein n=1 Tax=Flemingia macrophylla TaxID=520843 RepID=A0ABD1L6M4_9FABA
MECVLELPAQKEGSVTGVKKPERKHKEVDNQKKMNNGTRKSEKHEKVPNVSPYFWNDFEKKGVNGEDNRDEISVEKINSIRKKRLKKHGPQGDNEKKVDADSCYGSKGDGDEIAIEKIKSKRKRRSKNHEPQVDIGEKIPPELCYYGSGKNGDNAETNKFILKKNEPQDDNKEKNDPESCCYGCNIPPYGCDIGFLEEKLLADGNIKSKRKKKNKVVEDELREIGNDAEINKYILKRREPQGENKENNNTESYYGFNIEFVEEKLLTDGKIKSNEKKRRKKKKKKAIDDKLDIGFVEDKLLADRKIKAKEKKRKVVDDDELQDNGDGAETNKLMRELQGDNKEKNEPELCYGCNIGFIEEKLLADGKIKSREKKKKKVIEDKQWKHGDEAETSKFILKKREPLGDNKEKIEPELSCYRCDIGFVEEKLLADGKIKSREKKKKKVIEDKLWKHGDEAETSKFILKKREPLGENKEKIEPELSCYRCDIGFVEEKLLADGKIKSREKKKKKKVIEDKLWKHGDEAETSKFILKKCEPLGDNQCDIGFVEEKLLADGKIKSKEKKKKVIEDKLWKHGDEAETSKFILKKREPLGDNKEKIEPELSCYRCDIGFVEEKLLADGKIKSKEKKLQENGNDAETSNVKPKMTKSVEENIVQVSVKHAPPYFHNDSGVKFNVQQLNKENKTESIVLPTSGHFMEDKPVENNGGNNVKRQVPEANTDSVGLMVASGDFSDGKLKNCKRKIETIEVKLKKRKSNNRKIAEEHPKFRKVSPYFQNDKAKLLLGVPPSYL